MQAHRGFKIGIAWQGNSAHPSDRKRSVHVSHFSPIAAIPGVVLLSLQVGQGSEQLAKLTDPDSDTQRCPVTDIARRFDSSSFADAAAALAVLSDLVVMIGTSGD